MEQFLIYFLIYWGVLVIAYKYNIKALIRRFASWVKVKFFHDMSECEFCIDHHIGVIVTLLFWVYTGHCVELFFFPIMGASLSNIIKTMQ